MRSFAGEFTSVGVPVTGSGAVVVIVGLGWQAIRQQKKAAGPQVALPHAGSIGGPWGGNSVRKPGAYLTVQPVPA